MDLLWAYMPGLRPLFGCVTRFHLTIYDLDHKVNAQCCQKQSHRSVTSVSVSLFVCLFASRAFKYTSSPGVAALTHQLSTSPINFCDIPPVCAI
jgi:hypothetical protein